MALADDSLVPVPTTPLNTVPLPDDAPDWARVLYDQQVQIMQTMNATMQIIDAAAEEVKPIVESISSHPMFKMFGGRK